MILRKISVLNYKNIAQAELEFSPKMNCFIGHNGVGKTNLLDAVYFLSFCRSSTNPADTQNIRHGEDFFMLQGEYEHESGEREEVFCGLKRRQKKRFKRNKKEYKKLSEHIGLVPVVLVSPSDVGLISGGSEERRRFLDMVIAQYDHEYLDALARYDKALQQRNVLLKQEEEPDEELMGLLEEVMAREGGRIYEKRKAYVEAFTPVFRDFHARISQGKEQVGLRYVSHGQRGNLLEIIRSNRAKDRAVGYSLYGVHRDDLEMTLGDFPTRREGSQGQNKTYLIALKLAQFDFLRHTGSRTTPLLLLDDIFDKLDTARVEQIVKLVCGERFGQIFMTDTNRDHLSRILEEAGEDYKLFHVEDGTFKA